MDTNIFVSGRGLAPRRQPIGLGAHGQLEALAHALGLPRGASLAQVESALREMRPQFEAAEQRSDALYRAMHGRARGTPSLLHSDERRKLTVLMRSVRRGYPAPSPVEGPGSSSATELGGSAEVARPDTIPAADDTVTCARSGRAGCLFCATTVRYEFTEEGMFVEPCAVCGEAAQLQPLVAPPATRPIKRRHLRAVPMPGGGSEEE